jgi:20S proteasome alpha/beta subunit
MLRHPIKRKGTAAMTTCVAIICDNGKAIVLVTDKMIGTSHSEAAIGNKVIPFHQLWKAMFAGSAIEPVYPIVERAGRYLSFNDLQVKQPSAHDVRTKLREAWAAERGIVAEAQYLGRRSMTLEKLINEGKDKLPPGDFSFLLNQVDAFDFDLTIMVVGFDNDMKPHIFAGGGETAGVFKDYAGSHAIGSGARNAIMMINYREVKPDMSIREAVYYGVEAKFYGESAPGVSGETDVLIFQYGREDIKLADDTVEKVLFEKMAIPNAPRKLTPEQKKLLNGVKEFGDLPKLSTARTYKGKKAAMKAAANEEGATKVESE